MVHGQSCDIAEVRVRANPFHLKKLFNNALLNVTQNHQLPVLNIHEHLFLGEDRFCSGRDAIKLHAALPASFAGCNTIRRSGTRETPSPLIPQNP
ncbi:hypothetical protein [Niabella drilacis]|uniref:hypothetical protein n=1 Tax=Niabella drilacis (strain DSM 25811 / CCM 8410 / CCUG 62505 / LMG 26954 / E90) TaxID=1285928 RepID=UPI0015A3846C|nr:hypothetical protein [Niabella drilacis]